MKVVPGLLNSRQTGLSLLQSQTVLLHDTCACPDQAHLQQNGSYFIPNNRYS
jgi:hypothetical protein